MAQHIQSWCANACKLRRPRAAYPACLFGMRSTRSATPKRMAKHKGKYHCVCTHSVLTMMAERPGTAGSAGSNEHSGGRKAPPRAGHVRMSEPRRSSLTRRQPRSSDADAHPAGVHCGPVYKRKCQCPVI